MSEPSPGMVVTKGVTLVRHLGGGAMGSVWLADHAALQTRVVVKFMARSLELDETSVARFAREAAAASQVKSPHVVQMLDHGTTSEGQPFIVMEHLEGKDLGTYLTIVGRAPPATALAIVTQTARALGRAHEAGVIHRDIKPDNLFLTDTGEGEVFVKVLDFGVAKAPKLSSGKITTTGNVVGTPVYMSPEQIVGARDLDHRADLWALAVVTYEMLTGTVPFESDTPASLARAIGKKEPPPITALTPSLPRAVDDWFRRASHRDPDKRFQSARELASSLGEALASKPPPPEALDITQPDALPPSFGDTLEAPLTAPMPAPAVVPRAPTLVLPREETPKPVKRATGPVLALLLAVLCGASFVAWRALRVPAAAASPAPVAIPSEVPEVAVVDAAVAVGPPAASAEVVPVAASASSKIAKPAHAPHRVNRPAPTATGYDDIQ